MNRTDGGGLFEAAFAFVEVLLSERGVGFGPTLALDRRRNRQSPIIDRLTDVR